RMAVLLMLVSLAQYSSTPKPVVEHEVKLSQLANGAQLFVWSARQWMVTTRANRCVGCDLSGPYKRFECGGAVRHIDQYMTILTRCSINPVELRYVAHHYLSAGERNMLRVAQASQVAIETGTALAAASQLVGEHAQTLYDAARRYSVQLSVAGLNMASFRQLKLVFSRA
ncbi:MAG: hypothetical protein AAF680_09830, partial [Pseudomonadota bacterium]